MKERKAFILRFLSSYSISPVRKKPDTTTY
nr:MAG TPA_asm: hypothetical protein [Caudoviricetes sp.]